MELSIVTYIKKFGLDKAVDTFKLKVRDYPHKILLKYDQIESDMSFSEVQDCRGLVLEKDTWKVFSLAFRKFFNSAESQATKIDWDTAYVFEKLDGSLIQVYWDWVSEKWCAGTTGMAEGEGEVNDKPNTSFSELFWDTVIKKHDINMNRLVKGRTYSFELMTPYNLVVTPHGESKVALLGCRHLETLTEYSYDDLRTIAYDLNVPLVKTFSLGASNSGHLIATFDGMSAFDEGYVVCDSTFNRIKLKNPAYVALHHLKGKMANHHIMVIVKSNEIEEFITSFPDRTDEINELKLKYDSLSEKLEMIWEELKEHKPKNITKEEQKKFAMKVFEVVEREEVKQFSGLYFSLKENRVGSVKEYLIGYSDKTLYELFTK